MSLLPPGELGRRLLPALVDKIASEDPDRIIYSFMKTKDPAEGFHDVSSRALARAVDGCAWHIEEHLGRGTNFPTLLYMGPQDLTYAVVVLACNKAGYKVLLSSPRNTLEAHLSLLSAMDCHTFLMPPTFPLPIVKEILISRKMQTLEVPEISHWFNGNWTQKPYPYNKTWEEAALEPLVVLHTSGSTGLPKPIVVTHKTLAAQDAFSAAPLLGYPGVYPNTAKGTRVYMAMPMFHLAGLFMTTSAPLYGGFTTVLGPFPPSIELVNAVHVHGNVQHSVHAAMTWAGIAARPDYLENLTKLDGIAFGGGPCPEAIGNVISRKVQIYNCMGATETGLLPIQPLAREDWRYLSPSPLMKHEFRQVSDGLYELFIVRDRELGVYQGVFGTFPELDEYSMKDLYSKHPTKPDMWLYKGRSDDIIVFSSGEKLNPVDIEDTILGHPDVDGAVVAGQGYAQSSLLIEPKRTDSDGENTASLLEEIWPTIEVANNASPSHGRIHRDMIIFTSPGKPMLRAGKGTVQRKPTIDLYTDEIKTLYTKSEIHVSNGEASYTNGFAKTGDTVTMIRQIVTANTNINAEVLSDEDDLFERGLDSLQVIAIAKDTSNAARSNKLPKAVEAQDIYANPTLAGLVSCIEESGPEKEISGPDKVKAVYEEHVLKLPITGTQPRTRSNDSHIVLLTGATGSLGSYILQSLLKSPKVVKVYCLNRAKRQGDLEAHSRHTVRAVTRGVTICNEKIISLNSDITKPFLGLPREEYRTLVSEVTLTIHNAWKVDFNQSLHSFSGNISSVQHLIDLSANSTFGAEIFFISSVSTIASKRGNVAETIFDEWETPGHMGYAQSKYISERLLNEAAKESNIPTAVFRVGQIAGPTTPDGHWPKKEWLPSLIQSSKHLGKLPDSLGSMDQVGWVPVDLIGEMVVELATSPRKLDRNKGATVFHATNPHVTSWENLLPVIKSSLGDSVHVISFAEWLEALIESGSHTSDLDSNPALKIKAFFEDIGDEKSKMPRLETVKTVKSSRTLAHMDPVSQEWMTTWLKQWGY